MRQALRTRSYWILLAATVLRITLWGAISLHAVEMMVWKGMPRETAGFMFSLMFLLSIPLRLGVGILGDRFPLQPLMFGGMVSAAMAVLAMLLIEGNGEIYLFIILMALEQGGSTLNWVALGNFFGRANFGTLMGIISTCFKVGMLASPIYAGWLFDRTGSYTWVLFTFLPMYLLSAVLFLVVKKPAIPGRAPSVAVERVT